MRRSDRLFEIIQRLRAAARPLTAAALAEQLEVAPRTVYRDIAALQARRVPIEGAAGVGYVLRRGYDLPPLMFTMEEVEAIAVGARLMRRTGDAGLQQAAESVLSKITVILPDPMRRDLRGSSYFVSEHGARSAAGVDLAAIRAAIRAAHKLRIVYLDEQGGRTRRTLCPLALVYYVQATLVAGWCELRGDYRHFRTDRIVSLSVLEETFDDAQGHLLADWQVRHPLPSRAAAAA